MKEENIIEKGEFEFEGKNFSEDVFHLRISLKSNSSDSMDLIPYNVEERQMDEWRLEFDSGKVYIKKNEVTKEVFDISKLDKGEDQSEITLDHKVKKNSNIFGLGEKTGYLEKSGRKYEMWNRDPRGLYTHHEDPIYISIPFYLVENNINEDREEYLGVLINQPEKTHFLVKDDQNERVRIMVEGDSLNIYLIYGNQIEEVLDKYTDITGKPMLPPKWALGYHHSEWGSLDADDISNLAETYREKDIPCDSIYFDLQYMDDRRIFTWDEEKFFNPSKLMDSLHEKGFKVVPLIDPGVKVEDGYEVYETGLRKDAFIRDKEGEYFVGSMWPGFCHFPDFNRKSVRDWWAELNKDFLDLGVDGFWNDMNEPVTFFGKKNLRNIADEISDSLNNEKHLALDFDKKLDSLDEDALDGLFHKNEKGEMVPHEKIHNLYANLEAISTHQAFEEHDIGKRPFILSRSGFAGIQKYAAVWTGDNSSTWEHMGMSISMVLNLGLSGVPLAGADIGGFAGDTTPELFTRWIQLGSVLPFYRNHTSVGTASQSPWSFGEEFEDIIRKYIKFRYRILPYIYTLAFEAHENGTPIVRPLFVEFPNNDKSLSISDEFMLGSSLLIAPVLERRKSERLVYLPSEDGKSINWMDWWTGENYKSGSHIIDAPLEKMPIFLREDSGIPMTKSAQNTEVELDTLFLRCNLTGEKAVVPVYDDDGKTNAFKDGEYYYGQFMVGEVRPKSKYSVKVFNPGYDPFWKEIKITEDRI